MATSQGSQSQRQLPLPHEHSRQKSSHIIGTLQVGDKIIITLGRKAIIKYIGKVDHRNGVWYGIEFIDSVGVHNGTYHGKFYFDGQDKRCTFIQKSDIRAQMKPQTASTPNTFSADHANNDGHHDQHHTQQPFVPLPHDDLGDIAEEKQEDSKQHTITLKLRCMCIADPVPIEIAIDVATENIASLKQNIVTRCANKTRLSVFASMMETQSYAERVRLYVVNTNNNRKNNRLHIQSGNMVNCILKKYTQSFTELTDLNELHQLDGQLIFVLFDCEIDIKIVFQKTLFLTHDDEDEPLELVETDETRYCQWMHCRVSMTEKFDKLYSQIMRLTSIGNVNVIKLLSNNFIYNRSMWIEKYIYDNMDNDEELYLYFMHLSNHRSLRGGGGDGDAFQSNSSLHSNSKAPRRIKVLLNFVRSNKCEAYTIYDEKQSIKQLRSAISARFDMACDAIRFDDEIVSDDKLVKQVQLSNNDMLYVLDERYICVKILQSRLSGVGSEHKEFEMQVNKEQSIGHLKSEIANILKYPVLSQTLIMKEILSDDANIDELGIKHGDTLRLVYNFGRRVRMLPNDRRKIPIVSFDGRHRFDVVVNEEMFIYETMHSIHIETAYPVDKQQLFYRGVLLDKFRQWNEYDNIKFELHLNNLP